MGLNGLVMKKFFVKISEYLIEFDFDGIYCKCSKLGCNVFNIF